MRRHGSLFLIAFGAATLGCSDTGPGSVDLPEGFAGGSLLHGTTRGIGANTNVAVIPGDDAHNVTYRGTLGFDLTKIPSGASVTQATLTVTQCNVGGNPFGALGALVVDHIDLTAGLTDAAFSGETLESNIGTLSSTPAIGARTLDLTAQVQADMAAHRRVTGYRLRFSIRDTNNDSVTDFVQIALSRDGVCTVQPEPKLQVKYNR